MSSSPISKPTHLNSESLFLSSLLFPLPSRTHCTPTCPSSIFGGRPALTEARNRLASLYSDFSVLSTTNPDGYNANLTSWQQALSHAALAGVIPASTSSTSPQTSTSYKPNRLSLTLDANLAKALESKEWGQPLGLNHVLEDAVAKREWLGYKAFMDAKESLYAKRWIRIPGVRDVLTWTLRQLGLGFFSGGEKGGRVVVLGNLEQAGTEVLKRYEAGPKGRVERIYSRGAWKERFGIVLGGLSDSDVEVLLRFLERDKGVLVYDDRVVKFLLASEKGISQEDETIASLKTLIADMEVQVKALEARIEGLEKSAKEAVARKNRLSALSALRSKKLAEATLLKRQATLAQLEEVFMKIEQAADQVELVRVMDASAKALGSLNKEVGGVERVEGVVERLREEMEKTDEVGVVVGEIGRENGVDESEVDDELEVMESEERERREEAERKEREAREKKEAEETKKRLGALEIVEREARDKENARKQAEVNTEKEIEDSMMGMKRISLDPPETELA